MLGTICCKCFPKFKKNNIGWNFFFYILCVKWIKASNCGENDYCRNSIPSTTTLDAFRTKLDAAKNQCFVDVAFWGGIVPGNAVNSYFKLEYMIISLSISKNNCWKFFSFCFQEELKPMLNAGVVGFKCFLIHSGVDDFPHVEQADLETALKTLQGTDATVLVRVIQKR